MAIDPLAAGAYVIPQTIAPAQPAALREPGAPRLDETGERRDDRNRDDLGGGSRTEGREPAATVASAVDNRGTLIDIQA